MFQGSKAFGMIEFDGRSEDLIFLKDTIRDRLLKLEVLHVFEYTSERKRMSVVVREAGSDVTETGSDVITVYTKGADSAVVPLLRSKTAWESNVMHLERFAAAGLRTMCFAAR